jgi:hypothetical protein
VNKKVQQVKNPLINEPRNLKIQKSLFTKLFQRKFLCQTTSFCLWNQDFAKDSRNLQEYSKNLSADDTELNPQQEGSFVNQQLFSSEPKNFNSGAEVKEKFVKENFHQNSLKMSESEQKSPNQAMEVDKEIQLKTPTNLEAQIDHLKSLPKTSQSGNKEIKQGGMEKSQMGNPSMANSPGFQATNTPAKGLIGISTQIAARGSSNLWCCAVAFNERKWLSASVDPLDHCQFLTRLLKRRRSPRVTFLDHGPRSPTSRLKIMHRIEAPIMPFWKSRKIRHRHCGSNGHYIGHHARHISRPISCLTSSYLAPYSYHAHATIRVRERCTLAYIGMLKTQLIAQIALLRTSPHCHHRTPLGYALLYE